MGIPQEVSITNYIDLSDIMLFRPIVALVICLFEMEFFRGFDTKTFSHEEICNSNSWKILNTYISEG